MLRPFDFDALRAREFSRLDVQAIAYLDYAAAALYGRSQVDAYAERLARTVYGNPHSTHAPSLASMSDVAHAKAATLDFLDADPALYEVCLTANTSAALKLVAESYPFDGTRPLVLSADNHNSVNGAREFARAKGAAIVTLPLDAELRLDRPDARLAAIAGAHGAGLLAFPLQSNFSGVKHDPGLIATAQWPATTCCSMRRRPGSREDSVCANIPSSSWRWPTTNCSAYHRGWGRWWSSARRWRA